MGDYNDVASTHRFLKDRNTKSLIASDGTTFSALITEIGPYWPGMEREVVPDDESENGFPGFRYWKDFHCNPGNGSTCPSAKDNERVLFDTKMYIAADCYDIPLLKELATTKYATAAYELWDTPGFLTSARLVWEKYHARRYDAEGQNCASRISVY